MNEKFFELTIQKQLRIINAAYKVFSENTYKKASMSEIAAEGGISKSLLFHYFLNKKELYFYLWNHAMDMTRHATEYWKVLETKDLFEMLRRTLKAKCSLMREYPYIYSFSLRAYYEQLPEIKDMIQCSYSEVNAASEKMIISMIDRSRLRADVDIHMMYQNIIYACDGYMLEQYRSSNIDANRIEGEMERMIEHWEKVYSNNLGSDK